MAGRIPPDEASRSSQAFHGPFSEPRSQRRAPRQYPASLDTDLSLVTELRRSEEQATGQRSLPNNLVTSVFLCILEMPCVQCMCFVLYILEEKPCTPTRYNTACTN